MSKKSQKDMAGSLFSDRERMEMWINSNWKKCVVVSGIVIIVAAAACIWSYCSRKNDEALRLELASASVEALPALIDANIGHISVPAAQKRLADELMAQKKYLEAKAAYEKLSAMPNAAASLREEAKISAADALLAGKNNDGALAAYEAIFNDPAVSLYTRSQAGYQAVQLYNVKGDKAAAKKMLEAVAAFQSAGVNSVSGVYVQISAQMLQNIKAQEEAAAKKSVETKPAAAKEKAPAKK